MEDGIFRTNTCIKSINLKDLLKHILKTCREGAKIVVLYGIKGMPDGTIEKAERKQLINSFGYAIYSTKEENKEVIGDQNAKIQEISLENKSSTSIKNLRNVMEACKNANILVLSFDFSKQSILNSILESAGVYSDLKLNNKLFDLWNSSSDDSIRQALKKYEGMPCKNVLLGGSSGTMRTRILSQFLSIKICAEVEKPLRIIAVLNVPSKTSKIIQDISIKLLNFCDHLKTKSGTNSDIDIQFVILNCMMCLNCSIE